MKRILGLGTLVFAFTVSAATAFQEPWRFKSDAGELTATVFVEGASFGLSCNVKDQDVAVLVQSFGLAADRKLQVPFTIQTGSGNSAEVMMDCDVAHTCMKLDLVTNRDFSALKTLATTIGNASSLRVVSGAVGFDRVFPITNARQALSRLVDGCR
jgi:hypothetical protein